MAEQYVLLCVRLRFSTTIWVVLKCKRTQNKKYYSTIFNYVHRLISLI